MARRYGVRRILHSGVVAIIAINAAHLLIIAGGGESLAVFITAICATLFALGFVGPNATALAMEPPGGVAHAESSFARDWFGPGAAITIRFPESLRF